MNSSKSELLETASRLAMEAAQVVLDLAKKPILKNRKEDRSWITEADLRSDQILKEGLAKAFPDHSILSEESGLSGNQSSEWVWMVDPLDGTKAYAKGIPGFSVMVGLLKEGKPYLGVVVDPLEGLVYQAVRGEGAFVIKQGKKSRLSVSDRSDFSEMPLVTSPGFPEDILAQIVDRLRLPVINPINSVGIKVGLVVRQVADIYISHHPVHYWDTCAPQVILEEAGGCFTRLDGKPLAYAGSSDFSHQALTLASNATRHNELASLLSNIVNPVVA